MQIVIKISKSFIWKIIKFFFISRKKYFNYREIRLDIHVLNHEGNVADCAGVAGLAALAHFKRPDVSLEGDIVKVRRNKYTNSFAVP